MKFKEKDAIALASLLLAHDKHMEMHRNLALSPVCENPDMVDFANARDYFLVNLVDILAGKDIQSARKWLPTVEALLGVSEKADDKFYQGFFFALHEIPTISFRLDEFTDRSLNKDLFRKALDSTLSKLYEFQGNKHSI